MTRDFDEQAVIAMTQSMGLIPGLAFALACATRVAPAVRRASTEFGDYDVITSEAWALLGRVSEDNDSWKRLESRALRMMDALSEQEGELWADCAEDALACLAYAARLALGMGPENAGWSARRAYEAAERFDQDNGDVLTVERELARQARDLEECRGGRFDPTTLFERARSEAQTTYR